MGKEEQKVQLESEEAVMNSTWGTCQLTLIEDSTLHHSVSIQVLFIDSLDPHNNPVVG